MTSLKIQLWSYNYDPEPTGIAPVSTCLAKGLAELGHNVSVVAAHPHYPEPRWNQPHRPYRELRDGIPVVRLPLWIGRDNALQRYRQEISYMAALTAAAPFTGRPDVLIGTSPSFPALLPTILKAEAGRTPWLLWLHDILPDGAAASGIVNEGSPVIRLSRRLERAAYRSADRIVVLSRAFTDNLTAKGVPAEKIELIYDPATRVPGPPPPEDHSNGHLHLLSMGNIGFSQGLAELIGGFERAAHVNDDVRISITGNGMAAEDVREELRTGRVEMLGLVDDDHLERELQQADIGLVTQRHEGGEFNIPSKLMNFMAYGLPILAAVNPDGEVAKLVQEAGAGWVVDSSNPDDLPREIARIRANRGEIAERAAAATAYAERHFTQPAFIKNFERTLHEVAARPASGARKR
jgi:colanic acid biosynthesis glycosyl transferase WcaI